MTEEFLYSYNATMGLNSISATGDMMGVLATLCLEIIKACEVKI